MPTEQSEFWWEQLSARIGGDLIIGEVGPGAKNVAIGKHITQTVHEILGAPTPDDRTIIDSKLQELSRTISDLQTQLGESWASTAELQVKLLQGELTKTGEDDHPSANTITQVGDWLLDNVPEIAEILTGIFATPAVGRVVGKAGRAAVDWAKQRLGRAD